MTDNEIIKYAKSIGLVNVEEILKNNPIDVYSRELFEQATMFSSLNNAINKGAGEPEFALLPILDAVLKEGNIEGSYINKANLKKYNEANVLALMFFKNIKSFEIDLTKNSSFAQTSIQCEEFCIEDEKTNNRELFERLINGVDVFNVGAINAKTLFISFSVNNVWKE